MRIGEFAQSVGLTTATVRYYERRGLLDQAERASNNYRNYTPMDMRRIEYVLRARQLGLTLQEIRNLLRQSDAHHDGCRDVWQLLERKLRGMEETIVWMQQQSDRLRAHLQNCAEVTDCDPEPGMGCRLIASFEPGPDWQVPND